MLECMVNADKLKELWHDHRPVWKAPKKIAFLEAERNGLRVTLAQTHEENLRLHEKINWLSRELDGATDSWMGDWELATAKIDALQRTIDHLTRGYDALATALIARGGDPNTVHSQTPPTDR